MEGQTSSWFYRDTEEMPPKGLSVLPLIEKGIEGGISQL